jgi:predicted ATPase
MMTAANNWYVVTGGPSTGKTTLLDELNKLGYHTIPEAARTVIDEVLGKGISVETLRADEKRFQGDVARLKGEIEAAQDKNALTFFDRGMQDTLAYLRLYNFAVEDWVKALLRTSRYRQVFLLEPLPAFTKDYARTEDANLSKQLRQLLYDAYREHGMEPVIVPSVSVEERVQFVLQNID